MMMMMMMMMMMIMMMVGSPLALGLLFKAGTEAETSEPGVECAGKTIVIPGFWNCCALWLFQSDT